MFFHFFSLRDSLQKEYKNPQKREHLPWKW
jgi:hypothetical protein